MQNTALNQPTEEKRRNSIYSLAPTPLWVKDCPGEVIQALQSVRQADGKKTSDGEERYRHMMWEGVRVFMNCPPELQVSEKNELR